MKNVSSPPASSAPPQTRSESARPTPNATATNKPFCRLLGIIRRIDAERRCASAEEQLQVRRPRLAGGRRAAPGTELIAERRGARPHADADADQDVAPDARIDDLARESTRVHEIRMPGV